MWNHRALLWNHRALLWNHRALLWNYRALLWRCRALLRGRLWLGMLLLTCIGLFGVQCGAFLRKLLGLVRSRFN